MNKSLKILMLALSAALFISACKKNKDSDPAPENPVNDGGGDEEIITRVQFQFTDSANTGSSVSYSYHDQDGDLSNPAVTDTFKLNAGKTYLAEVTILNETQNPPVYISDEIREEANYHRFHYSFLAETGSAAAASVTITDTDTRTPAQPLGLMFKLKTGPQAGKAVFNVNLRHFGNNAEKNENPEGGEQDILINFPVSIK